MVASIALDPFLSFTRVDLVAACTWPKDWVIDRTATLAHLDIEGEETSGHKPGVPCLLVRQIAPSSLPRSWISLCGFLGVNCLRLECHRFNVGSRTKRQPKILFQSMPCRYNH